MDGIDDLQGHPTNTSRAFSGGNPLL
jgi:hypothetical protein